MHKRRLVVLTGILLATALAAEPDKAEVISFTGKAEYQTENGWVPLSQGSFLDQGTVISTGFRSTAVLKIGDSRFTVEPLSRITISKLSESDQNYDTEMNLSTGKLKIDVKAVPGRTTAFTVRSPTATASVRGTSGEFSAAGTLTATTGVWTYTPQNRTKNINVEAGQSIQTAENGIVTAPQQEAQKKAAGSKDSSSTKTLATEESISTVNISTGSETYTSGIRQSSSLQITIIMP